MSQEIKVKLSQAYRILGYLGLDDHTYTHLSARSADSNAFYIYPFGLRFEEVTPDILMKVSLTGEVLEGNECQYNRTGYVLHTAIYNARPDIKSIFHIHTHSTTAVSICEDGLLPISQWALHFFEKIAYHEYNSLLLDFDGTNELINDLGQHYIMFLRNHGAVICGKTIEEAMFFTYHLENACKTQHIALSMGQKLITPTKEVCKQSVNDLLTFESSLGKRDWDAWIRCLVLNNLCDF
jgi:ribulose-5-phosphate 4-epimerase/fuculose-1-phosphate aldolase